MVNKIIPPGKKNYHLPALALIFGILAFTFLLYLKSLSGGFLDYDDTDNVVNNAMIRRLSPDYLLHLFSAAKLYMYAPLTFITYATDYYLSGLDPYFFKLSNLLLHLLNVTMVFLLARRLFRNISSAAVMALLFALHPLNVDSVSWISARSNLLSTLFFILALLLYLHYLVEKKIIFLFLVTLSFLLSLLSKSAGIMLPVTLLLVDFLKGRKITLKVTLEKLPLFFLGIAFGLVAIYFRSDTGTRQSVMEYNIPDRLVMICYSLTGYLFRSVLPFNLSAVYAYPLKNGDFLPFLYYLTPVLIAGLIFLISRMKILKREVIFGLLFLMVNILLTQLVVLEDGFMANRYGYLPCIGLFYILAAAFDNAGTGTKNVKNIITISFILLFLVFSVVTYRRSQVWHDTLTLFNDVVEHSPGSAFGYNNRGIARYSGNDMDGALSDYDKAITLFPRYSGAYYNRGIVWYNLKEIGKANDDYTMAIRLNPGFASCYMARGILEMDAVRNDTLAMADYNRAILLNPNLAQAYYNRGLLRLRMEDAGMACEDFHRVRLLGYSRADDLIRQFCE